MPAVTVNDRQGIRLAVEHVAESRPHSDIGHVGGPQNISTGHRRHLGFLEAMATAGLGGSERRRSRFGRWFVEEEGARVCAELLDRGARADRDRGRQRSAGHRLLRHARGARPALPAGHLGRRLQRHAVRRPPAPAADLGAGAAARDRHGGRRSAAQRLADGSRDRSRDPARADADRARIDGAAAQADTCPARRRAR